MCLGGLGDKCPRGKCPRGKCPRGKCLGGLCPRLTDTNNCSLAS